MPKLNINISAINKWRRTVNGNRWLIFIFFLSALMIRFAENKPRRAAYNQAYYHAGVEYDTKEKFHRAISYYKKAIEQDPHFIYPYYFLGVDYGRIGDRENQLKIFKLIADLDFFSDYEVYYVLAQDYQNQGDLDKAIHYYIQTIRYNLRHIDSYWQLASIYESKGDYDSAINYYNALIMFFPKRGESYFSLGKAYFKKGDMKSAYAQVAKLKALNADLLASRLENFLGNQGNVKSTFNHE